MIILNKMTSSTFAIVILTITLVQTTFNHNYIQIAGVKADYSSCYSDFDTVFTEYLETASIATLLEELTEEVCYPEVSDI